MKFMYREDNYLATVTIRVMQLAIQTDVFSKEGLDIHYIAEVHMV